MSNEQNGLIIGSSPTFGAIFPQENASVSLSRTDSAQNSGGPGGLPTPKVRFPVTIRHRQAHAKIYAKTMAYPFYRLSFRAAGKRHIRSFSTFAEARKEAEAKVREISNGNQAIALTPKEARDALAIRDALQGFEAQTGRTFTALEAVTGFLDAVKQLPEGCGLGDSVRAYAVTVATVKSKLIAEAVEEFINTRKPKTQAVEGRRSQLSPVYAAHVESWLREFAATFPGHRLGDLNREFLGRYIGSHVKLSAKSRNDRRAALGMFLRWCVRQDYLPTSHRLLEADAMQKETVDGGITDYYRPAELQALLESATGQIRAVTALQGLAGLRLEEALRLNWSNVFGLAGHVEITAQHAKTRRRRLVEMCPALAAWIEPFRGVEGRIWTDTSTMNGFVSAFARLRESLKIPSRRNGLRHAFCTYHFALHSNENLTAALAGNSPAMIHQHYKGLATKAEAEKWFEVSPTQEEKT